MKITDRLSRLRFVQTVRPFHPILGIKLENILSPLYEMKFTNCQRTDHHYYSLSDRTDRMINASILNMCGPFFSPYPQPEGPFRARYRTVLWHWMNDCVCVSLHNTCIIYSKSFRRLKNYMCCNLLRDKYLYLQKIGNDIYFLVYVIQK